MKIINIFFIFAAFALAAGSLLTSCKGKNDLDYEEINIPIDQNRIGNEFVEMNLKFKFNPPKGWMLKPSDLTEKIVSRQKSDKELTDSFVYKPMYVFFSDSTRGILMVGTIDKSDSSKLPMQIQRYEDELIARYNKGDVHIKNFIKDKIMISQLTVDMQSIISRKLILKNIDGQYLQFDYTMQKASKDIEENAIMSSIGSLKLVK